MDGVVKGKDSSLRIVTPGEVISNDSQYMRGHGTYLVGPDLCASVAGKVQRVNKLISVIPTKSRYIAEVGDVVVGRIIEVGSKRWRVDVGAKMDAQLLLSSVHLPGGVQRRKQESDELSMRTFFADGDLLVAEVQQFFSDGAVSLHTRSLKYGKLRNGILLQMPPSLIQRSAIHFLEFGDIDVILGVNGMIWICKHRKEITTEEIESKPENLYTNNNDDIDSDVRNKISRMYNCLNALASKSIQINEIVIKNVYENSMEFNVCDILSPIVRDVLLANIKHVNMDENKMDLE
jgi:exosome complex component RRP4